MKANRWTAVIAEADRLGVAHAPAGRVRVVPVGRAAMDRAGRAPVAIVGRVASATTAATNRAAKRPCRCRTST